MNRRTRWSLATAACLAAALFTPAPGSAQEAGPREGIHVRGEWVLEVREPDGSVVDRREFTNDLVEPVLLSQALAGARIVNVLYIALDTECAGAGVSNYSDATLTCELSGNLPSVVTSGADAGALVLEQTGTIQLSGGTTDQITEVATLAVPCPPTGTAGDCLANGNQASGDAVRPLTRTTLPAPVDVAEGQTVVVTVTITFN